MDPSATPWWEALPEDFSTRRESFELTATQQIEVATCAAMDRAVSTATATVLSALLAPTLSTRGVQRQLELLAFYARDEYLRDPARFFVRPAAVVLRRETVRPVLHAPRHAFSEDIRWQEAFEPVNPEARGRYLAHSANRVSHARHFFHGDRPRATVIALHGFWASPYWANSYVFEVPWLFRLGLDVVLPTMPFHGPRRMKGALFSGHGFVSPHMEQLNEAVAHTVSDVRVLMRDLASRGVTEIGVTGVSLGGYVSALMACLEPTVAFAVPNVPVVSLVDLILDWSPLGPIIRSRLARSGKSIASARRMFAMHSPLSYPRPLPKERLMVIAGAGDRMSPPSQARLLWEHWGQPRAYYFPGNHLVHFDRGGYLRMLARFLAGIGVLPPRQRKAA